MRLPAFVCLSICLSVSKITQKRVYGFKWNVACRQMSGHGRTDPDYSLDAGTGLLSPLSYISHATRNFTSGKSDVYVLAVAATRGFTMVLFTEPMSRRNTFVGGTCAPPSSLLVCSWLFKSLITSRTVTRRSAIAKRNRAVMYQPCSFHASMIFFPSHFACSQLRSLLSRSDSKISLERRLFMQSRSPGAVRITTATSSAERRSPALLATGCILDRHTNF